MTDVAQAARDTLENKLVYVIGETVRRLDINDPTIILGAAARALGACIVTHDLVTEPVLAKVCEVVKDIVAEDLGRKD